MKRLSAAAVVILGLLSMPAFADQDDFCRGFEEGYKAVRGDMVIVPICPIAPITPIGSNDYREGLKAGMEKGKEDEGES